MTARFTRGALGVALAASLAWLAPLLRTETRAGHEYRNDDWPSIAAARDGSLWLAWVSFNGERDEVGLRRHREGKWEALQWIPGSLGDNWMPQVAVDGSGRVWVVWARQDAGNWDLVARWFDPARQSWGPLERLTSDPLPDTNPRIAERDGKFALVWQGWRDRESRILMRRFDGERWGPEIRVTSPGGNDWDPAVALDSAARAWVAFDSYRNGNYDVFLARVEGDRAEAPVAVANSPRFEARATVAVDTSDRPWVAWEEGPVNWGKDQGYIIRDRQTGALLEGERHARLRCYSNGQWLEPPPPAGLENGKTNQPHVFSDGGGSVWLAVRNRVDQNPPGRSLDGYMPHYQRGYWEYRIAHLEGGEWSAPQTLPNSRGRSSTRMSAAALPDGRLAAAWPADFRADAQLNRPLRQEVYADILAAPARSPAPELRPARQETVRPLPGHRDEAGDVRALRERRIEWNGKRLRLVRGDFHRHTELSWDVGGGFDGSLQDFYRYMIDVAALDFGASTDHQGGLWPYWWWYTQKLTDMYNVPGRYTAVFGYERSANQPNGHRNMFFARRSDARVTPFFLKSGARGFTAPQTPAGDEPSGTAELVENDTKLLYEDIRPRNAISIPHSSANRMGTDWRDNDPALEPVAEIFQGCRTSNEQEGAPYVAKQPEDAAHIKVAGYFPEGMLSKAWGKGYKLGVIASSDHFSTHISYAMVYTEDTGRQGILDAIRKRHTYGATDNILLEVRMGAHLMGDEFSLARAEPIRIVARGTAPVARLDVIKDSRTIYSARPGGRDIDLSYTDRGDVNGRHYYYVRLMQSDGMIAWSSPFFVNYAGR